MTDRFKEKEGYLSDEFEQRSFATHLRSVSPHPRNAGSNSPRRSSRSPLPAKVVEQPPQTPTIRDSRPDITAWPTPPGSGQPALKGDSSSLEEPSKFITMLKVATGSSGLRGRETELKKKIQTLEDTVAEYERQKYNVMGTFSEYRERVAERERKLEAEYSSKIIALSEEVLGAKKDFEARMKSFQALQDKFEREKEQALEKLRQEHQKEIQLLEQRFSESQLLNLEQKYMIEIQRLEEERKSLKTERERLGETFETKLRRAQSLYETELTAAKMLYSKELEALRDHEEALKEELLARQEEFHDRLQELQLQSKRSREELAVCKNEVTALEKRLQAKEAEVLAISKELEDARNETNESLRKLSKVENELHETKQRYREQEEELQHKTNEVKVLDMAKSKLEALLRDLETEVKTLKSKVEFLEKERENLQSQSESQTQVQNSQVKALEAVLETVTKEKESTKEHYEGLLDKERQQAQEREFAMKKEFTTKLNELEDQYNSLKDQFGNVPQYDRDEVHERLQSEIETLQNDNISLTSEIMTLKAQLQDGSAQAKDRTEQESFTLLTDRIEELRNDLGKSKKTIFEQENQIETLKKQLENLPKLTSAEMDDIRQEIRLEILSSAEFAEKEAEIKSLREKCEKLEAEAEHNKRLKVRSEESNNSDEPNNSVAANRNDKITTSYVDQIEELQNELQKKQTQLDELSKEFDAKKRTIRRTFK